jgi:hypothetical protein
MIRPAFAALAAFGFLAVSTSAIAQEARTSASPTAAASASRRDTPDEPGSSGAGVDRRSQRGREAGERKISDFDIATAPVNEVAKTSRHSIAVGGRLGGRRGRGRLVGRRDRLVRRKGRRRSRQGARQSQDAERTSGCEHGGFS